MYEKELAAIDRVIASGKYKDHWESLAAYPVPEWYREAKFGAFIHWGAYAVPAYFSECGQDVPLFSPCRPAGQRTCGHVRSPCR